jgi:hypothetical protein
MSTDRPTTWIDHSTRAVMRSSPTGAVVVRKMTDSEYVRACRGCLVDGASGPVGLTGGVSRR